MAEQTRHTIPLPLYIQQTVEQYFVYMADHDPVKLHATIMDETEKALLKATLAHYAQNQTKAAKALGLSRSTLRKKIVQYALD
jgi:Fis family transcriptional regulator